MASSGGQERLKKRSFKSDTKRVSGFGKRALMSVNKYSRQKKQLVRS